jgi:hypothetical protein
MWPVKSSVKAPKFSHEVSQGPGTPVPPDHSPESLPGLSLSTFQFRSRFPFSHSRSVKEQALVALWSLERTTSMLR